MLIKNVRNHQFKTAEEKVVLKLHDRSKYGSLAKLQRPTIEVCRRVLEAGGHDN